MLLFFKFRGFAYGGARFNRSEKLRKFGTKTLGAKTLPLVTMHNGALFESHIDFISRGFAYAKLNLIFSKNLLNFVTKMLGTKSLPMVTMLNGALFKSHTK